MADVSGMPRMPSFAPDGSLVAFVNQVGGTDQIFVKQRSLGPARQLTFGAVPARRPRWSPNGDQILYCRGASSHSSGPAFGHESFWAVPPRGGTAHLVIEDGRNPNWSGDGTRIVFERRDEIWVAGRDGQGQVRVEGVPGRSARQTAPRAARWRAAIWPRGARTTDPSTS
jgi:Tol biopolymer transport system component